MSSDGHNTTPAPGHNHTRPALSIDGSAPIDRPTLANFSPPSPPPPLTSAKDSASSPSPAPASNGNATNNKSEDKQTTEASSPTSNSAQQFLKPPKAGAGEQQRVGADFQAEVPPSPASAKQVETNLAESTSSQKVAEELAAQKRNAVRDCILLRRLTFDYLTRFDVTVGDLARSIKVSDNIFALWLFNSDDTCLSDEEAFKSIPDKLVEFLKTRGISDHRLGACAAATNAPTSVATSNPDATPAAPDAQASLRHLRVDRRGLIPIVIDVTVGTRRFRDSLSWHVGQSKISPELFASQLCIDEGLPEPFLTPIARSIRAQIVHCPPTQFTLAPRKRRSPSDGSASRPRHLVDITINITIKDVFYHDRFQWDILDSLDGSRSPEAYARRVTVDVGLPRVFQNPIAQSIRTQVLAHRHKLLHGGKGTIKTEPSAQVELSKFEETAAKEVAQLREQEKLPLKPPRKHAASVVRAFHLAGVCGPTVAQLHPDELKLVERSRSDDHTTPHTERRTERAIKSVPARVVLADVAASTTSSKMPRAPKPATEFLMFSRKQRQRLETLQPDLEAKELTREVNERWTATPEDGRKAFTGLMQSENDHRARTFQTKYQRVRMDDWQLREELIEGYSGKRDNITGHVLDSLRERIAISLTKRRAEANYRRRAQEIARKRARLEAEAAALDRDEE